MHSVNVIWAEVWVEGERSLAAGRRLYSRHWHHCTLSSMGEAWNVLGDTLSMSLQFWRRELPLWSGLAS